MRKITYEYVLLQMYKHNIKCCATNLDGDLLVKANVDKT